MKRKQLEFWGATLLLLLACALILSSTGRSLGRGYSSRVLYFMNIPFGYSYLFNYFLPLLIIPLLYYCGFLCVNFLIYPRSVPRKKFDRFIGLSILATGIMWLLFALVLYWWEVYQLRYPDAGRNLFHFLKTGFPPAFIFALLMLLYLVGRERIYPVLMKNRETDIRLQKLFRYGFLFSCAWLALMILTVFTTGDGHSFMLFMTFCAAPVAFLYYIVNYFWLIPFCENLKYRYFKYFLLAVVISFLLSFSWFGVFYAISGRQNFDPGPVYMTFWVILLLVVSPIAWVVYHQAKKQTNTVVSLRSALSSSAANLDFLKSQINPHFLFNALNTLYGTAIQENGERTARGIQKLGDMMRFMLHENICDKIPLYKEIRYLKDYIDIQKLRTQVSDDIMIETWFSEACNEKEIAPMLLIPFVENAFKYGISLRYPSWIRVSLSCNEEELYFDVTNSLHPKLENNPEIDGSGIGLENVKQRLSLLYPGRHELTTRQSATEYFVHLTIRFSHELRRKKQ